MDHNPFLQRGQREEDQTPSLPDPENPFTSAQGRAAISATAGLVTITWRGVITKDVLRAPCQPRSLSVPRR